MLRSFAFMFLFAQSSMTMPGMENSVGFLSAGTSIEPASTSESSPMVHRPWRGWTFMLHADAVLANIQQSGPRGRDKTFSTNWIMPMLTRQAGRHQFSVRTMLSLEPLTVTRRRYPLLLQTGETAYGLPIVDGQHPHDLVMELSARYDFRFNDRVSAFVYGGPIGDPALGPPAFVHRASSSENPLAVLGHHQQDSTHISNSVITYGLVAGRVQVEASTFHGREPNENRWNFDGGEPDSFSTRITVAPTHHLVGQFSFGGITSREASEPDVDSRRTTASVHHNVPFTEGHLATSLVWGRNKDLDPHAPRVFNAYTLESTANLKSRNWLWTRVENADRDRTTLFGEVPAVRNVEETSIGRVQALTFGYARDLPSPVSAMTVSIGAQATTYWLPELLKPLYGDRPATFLMFLRLRPKGNMAEHMRMMHNH